MSTVRHIFRWDLDKTYLKTEFDTIRDLVRTARTPAERRENIPGSAALIRAIREAVPDGFKNLVFFISGSPQQLRPTLERKFELDGFSPDGFVLKPTLSNFFRGRFRAIRGQVAYKLAELLQGRADAPVGTQETLFGDDAESDAFIYSLYADVVAGAVSRDDLLMVLKKTGAYDDQVGEIERALEAIVHERPVKRIIIHLDQRTPPAAFLPYAPLVVPIYNHLQTAVVLAMDQTVPAVCVRLVARELVHHYGYDVQRLSNLAEDILRRIRGRYPLERLEALAQDLDALPPTGPAASSPEAESATGQLVTAIADRARYLRHRPLVEEAPASSGQRRWLELLEHERVRKEEMKLAKKLAERSARPASDDSA